MDGNIESRASCLSDHPVFVEPPSQSNERMPRGASRVRTEQQFTTSPGAMARSREVLKRNGMAGEQESSTGKLSVEKRKNEDPGKMHPSCLQTSTIQ